LNLEFRNLLNKIAQENPDAFLDSAGKLLREAVSPDGTVRIQPSELRPLITLSPDLIDKLAEQPAALPLVLRDPAVFETLM